MADNCWHTGSLGHKPQNRNEIEDELRQNVIHNKTRNKEETVDRNLDQNRISDKSDNFETSQEQAKISTESSGEILQSGDPPLERCTGSRNCEGGDNIPIQNKDMEQHEHFEQNMPESPQNVDISFHFSKSPHKSQKHGEKCQKKQICRKCPSLKRPITSIIRKFLANRFQASATLQRAAANHEEPSSSSPLREAKVTSRVLANQDGDRSTNEDETTKSRESEDEKLDGEKERRTEEGVSGKFHEEKAGKCDTEHNTTENEDDTDAGCDKRQDNVRTRRRPKEGNCTRGKSQEEEEEGEEEREESERLNNNNNNNNATNNKNSKCKNKMNNKISQDSHENEKSTYDDIDPAKNSHEREERTPIRGVEKRKTEKGTQRKKTEDAHHHAITSPTTSTRSLISRQIRDKTAKLGSPVKTARVSPLQTAKFSSHQARSPVRVAAKLHGTSSPTLSPAKGTPAKTLHSRRICPQKIAKTRETSECTAKKRAEEDHSEEEEEEDEEEEKETEERMIKTNQIRDNHGTHNGVQDEVGRDEHRIRVKTTPPAANRKNGFIANLRRIANGTSDPLAGLKRGKHSPSSPGECCVVAKMRSSPNVRARRLMKEYKVLSNNSAKFFSVDLVNDCLDEWMVRLYRVDQDSLLHRDMQELGVTHILLSLSFPENFPFHPPFLRVLSPRLEKGFVMEGGAICMELLTPRGWASAYTIEAIIMQFAASLVKGQGRICRKVKGTSGKEFSRRSAESAFKSLVRTHERYGWVTPPLSEG